MIFATRLALCCVLVMSTLAAVPASTTSAADILERMRLVVGPAWSDHLTSSTEISVNGAPKILSNESQGLAFFTRQCAGQLCTGTYFDGERLFSVNINGTALPRSVTTDRAMRALRTIASFAFLSPDFAAGGGHVEDAGVANFAGGHFDVLHVRNIGAAEMDVYVDPATSLVRYTRNVTEGSTYEFATYQTVDRRLVLPSIILRNGEPFQRDFDRHISRRPFLAPNGLRVTIASPNVAIPTDPDIEMPIVDCSVEGMAARCLLDSGDSGLSISSQFAERIHARDIGTFDVSGLGMYATRVVAAGALQVGSATFEPARYVVLDDIGNNGYDVVLGSDVFGATTIELDPQNHLVRFDADSPPTDAIAIPLTFENFIPVVDVRLGDLLAHLAVDTGDESNVNLSYDFYLAHPSLFHPTERRSVSGVGGTSIELIGDIPDIAIGAYRGGAERIGTTMSLKGTAFGHLGDAFLSNFQYFFNYADSAFFLVPNGSQRSSR